MNKYFCTNRSLDFTKKVEEILQTKKQEILDFFNVEDDGNFNFNVYIYDTKKELVEGLKSRGFSEDPDYMCACRKDEDNSLNFYEPEDKSDDDWTKEEYFDGNIIFHEEVHGIQNLIYGEQPEWLTEGIAKYLDGTYSKGIKYILEEYIHKVNTGKGNEEKDKEKIPYIPSIDELKKDFGLHQDYYDSYDYAFLCVSYLIEILGKDEFLKRIGDKEELAKLEENLTYKAVAYYNQKYFGNKFYNADPLKPLWLFHGSSDKLDTIETRVSNDLNEVGHNIDNAIFLSSNYLVASAYSFKNNIKSSDGEEVDFFCRYGYDSIIEKNLPVMEFSNNGIIDENTKGYIYVIPNNISIINDPVGSLQFKSYNDLEPYAYNEIIYKDFSPYYKKQNKNINEKK